MDPRPLSYWWKRAALWTVGSILFAFALVWLLRNAFGNTPTWEPQVYNTVAATFGAVGFLIGIGCFDWWWRWITGRRVRLRGPLDARRPQLARLLQGQHRPQGHRGPVPRHRLLLLRDRRDLRRAGARRAGRAGPVDRRRRDLQRPLQRARHADDLPLRHPGVRRPGELRAADHDRRQGHGVPASERPVDLDADPGRADDGREPRLRGVLDRLDGLHAARQPGRHRADPLRGGRPVRRAPARS